MDQLYLILSVVILSIFLIICLIRESIERRKLLKIRLGISCIISFASIVILIIYKGLTNPEIVNLYICPSLILIIGLLITNSIFLTIRQKTINDVYLSCITDQYFFVYLNKKLKIRNISDAFAEFFNISVKEASNHRFDELLKIRYSNIHINEESYSEDNLTKYFDSLKEVNTDSKLEIECMDLKGNLVELCLVNRPIINNNKFVGYIIFGKRLTKEILNKTEEELTAKNIKLEMARMRFATILENGNDCVYFYNINANAVWANDKMVKTLGFSGNSITFDEFKKHIHPEDLAYYLDSINSLNISNPTFDIKYRFRNGYDYSYVREKGKKIYGPQTEIVSIIELNKSSNAKYYDVSSDKLEGFDRLYKTIDSLRENVFELCYMTLDNIEDINKVAGREAGDIVMQEYVQAIISNFVDNDYIFRLNGLEFCFIVTDFAKMNKLKQALLNNKIVHARTSIGDNKYEIFSSIGIISNKDIKDPKKLVEFAKGANKVCHNEGYGKRYYYHD